MARVIKAGGERAGTESPRSPRRPTPRLGQSGRPVIEKEVFRAQEEARERRAQAEQQRERILAEGRQRAQQARELAQLGGAEEAFAQAAHEALRAFRRRAERYAEAAGDIQILATEVVKKILGNEPAVTEAEVRAVLDEGLARLRARRRLRMLLPAQRLLELRGERPALMAALEREPELVLEAQDDVSPGFTRVVTEAGGALCSEETALDELTEALSVVEHAPPPPIGPDAEDDAAARAAPAEAPPAGPMRAATPASRAAPASEVDREQAASAIRRGADSHAPPPRARNARPMVRPLPPMGREEGEHVDGRGGPPRRVRPLEGGPARKAPPARPERSSERVRPLAGTGATGGSTTGGSTTRPRPVSSPRPPSKPGPERTQLLDVGARSPRLADDEAMAPVARRETSLQDAQSFAEPDSDLFADDAPGDPETSRSR